MLCSKVAQCNGENDLVAIKLSYVQNLEHSNVYINRFHLLFSELACK